MIDIVFRIFLFFFMWWLFLKVMRNIDKSNTEYYERRKPNYGSFYNPLIEDNRVFYLGQRVCCNGKKFSIFEYEFIHYVDIRITKLTLLPENTTDETKYYNIESDGFVVDSRCVKELVKC